MSNSGLGIYTIKINVCSDKSLSINRALTPPLTLHLLVGRNLISVTKDMMGTPRMHPRGVEMPQSFVLRAPPVHT